MTRPARWTLALLLTILLAATLPAVADGDGDGQGEGKETDGDKGKPGHRDRDGREDGRADDDGDDGRGDKDKDDDEADGKDGRKERKDKDGQERKDKDGQRAKPDGKDGKDRDGRERKQPEDDAGGDGSERAPAPPPVGDAPTPRIELRQDMDAAGKSATYQLTVRNVGDLQAALVVLNADLPAGVWRSADPACQVVQDRLSCEMGQLAAGDEREVEVAGVLRSDPYPAVVQAVTPVA